MYHEFFQLSKPPFNNTPDPAFFFASRDHEEALATMYFGVEQRRGFVLVTGEVGSGKTLLVRMLLQRLGASASIAVIDRPPSDEKELLTAVCGRLGVRVRNDASSNDLLGQLERFLMARNASGRICVVLIDEAQSLSMAALEQLRMLGNLETATDKLLQVVMLGQPELQDTLNHPALKQLRQRLYCARHLSTFTPEQTVAYIEHRLSVAGAEDRALFTPEAMVAVHGACEGLPRMINHICDNSLLMAFSESKPVVDKSIVGEVLDRMMNLHSQPNAGAEATIHSAAAGGAPGDRPHGVLDAPVEHDLGALCARATSERNELATLLRDISASREAAAVERAQLAGAVTRGREVHEGLATLLASCDREADKLFIVEDRATAKTDDLSRGLAAAEALHKRLTSRVSRGFSLLRALGHTGESAKELREELACVCNAADAHAGELKVLSTSAGLRAEQLQAAEQQAADVERHLVQRIDEVEQQAEEIGQRLQHQLDEGHLVAARLERDLDARRAEIDTFTALVASAGERERALHELIPAAGAAESRCADGRDTAAALHAELSVVADNAREQLRQLRHGVSESARQRVHTGRAVRRAVRTTRALDQRLAAAERREQSLSAVSKDGCIIESRLGDAALAGQSVADRLDGLSSTASERAAALDGAVSHADRVEATLASQTKSAVTLHESLERVAGQAALSVGHADRVARALDARSLSLGTACESAQEAASRVESAVASAAGALDNLEDARRTIDKDARRVESLILRAESAVESIDDLGQVREVIARTMTEAAASADGLTDSLATLDQRMERVGSALRLAEVTGEKLEHAVERGTDIVDRVTASERQFTQVASQLEAATAASCEQNESARKVAERIEVGVQMAAESIRELETLREQIDEAQRTSGKIASQIEALAAKLEDVRKEPERLVSEAATATQHLTEAIQVAGRVVRGLSSSASRVREQIHTLKEVRASSDRGVSRLLEQSRASADALRQWVTDAEAVRSRIDSSLPSDDDLGHDDSPDENGSRVPDLLPALEAIRERRT